MLSKVLKYSRRSLKSLLQAVVYNIFKVVEFIHWSVISTLNQSEGGIGLFPSSVALLEESENRLTETQQVIRKAEQKYWKESIPTVSRTILSHV